MERQIIRLTESDLHKIVKETVKKVLKEKKYGVFGSDDADPEDLYNWWPKKETDTEKVDRLHSDRRKKEQL